MSSQQRALRAQFRRAWNGLMPIGLGVSLVLMAGGTALARSGGEAASMSGKRVSYETVGFEHLPGWAEDDHLAAYKAFLASCPRLIAAARAGNKASGVDVPAALLATCREALDSKAKPTRATARAFFESRFVPQRVVHRGPQGLLTGYFEAALEGSRTADGRFRTPVYRRPADLVNLVHETQRGAVGAKLTHARKTAAGIVPFATRAEIERGALAGQGLELLYLADPVDKFFLQVQGSGVIRMPDGTSVRVHYDGKNGHPYTSIGRYLIDKGMLAADKVSMGALARFLRADPARAREVMDQNRSYVFFRELPHSESSGPLGVLSIPLMAGRSLAVDGGVHAIGLPIYVAAPSLRHAVKGKPFQRLMVAHDVGSAIKGPERGDIYFGSGVRAARIAGVTKHPGNLFVLVPKETGAGLIEAAARKGTARPRSRTARP